MLMYLAIAPVAVVLWILWVIFFTDDDDDDDDVVPEGQEVPIHDQEVNWTKQDSSWRGVYMGGKSQERPENPRRSCHKRPQRISQLRRRRAPRGFTRV